MAMTVTHLRVMNMLRRLGPLSLMNAKPTLRMLATTLRHWLHGHLHVV